MNALSSRLFLFGALAVSIAACGSSRALKHTVPDKELAGLTGDVALGIDSARGEVQRAEDELRMFDGQIVDTEKQLDSVERQQDAADEAVDAAKSRIEATRDSEEKELDKARARRDEQIAAVKKTYEEEARAIRERFATEQSGNREKLAEAKGSKALADLEKKHQEALLRRNEAEKAVRGQVVWLKKAELEQKKLEALLGMKAVQTQQDEKRRLEFEGQVLTEKATLTKLQAELLKKDQELQTLKSRVDQERARSGGGAGEPAAE